MVNLYLIRHARQCIQLCNLDVELTIEGRKQAKLLRDRIKNYDIDALYSSDLIRAKQTAEIINESFGLPHQIRVGMREISFGLLEGHSDEYIKEHFADFVREQKRLVEDIPFPGGENGQTVYERAMPVIKEIAQSGDKNIVIVTHGGVIRALLGELFGKSQAHRFLFAASLENSSITQLVYEEKLDRFYLERFNDCAHLEGYPQLSRRAIPGKG